jgi:pimeloyl-ACP methyl ester carboxylesterase
MKPSLLALILWLLSGVTAGADPLPRRLDFGWVLGSPSSVGATVKRVAKGGAAEHAGVKPNDRVLQVGATSLADDAGLSASRFAGRAGHPIPVLLLRDAKPLHLQIIPSVTPQETHTDIDTEWGTVTGSDGARLRTIITLPRGRTPHPVVFIIGWLSCDSVEIPSEHPDATALLMADVIEHSDSAVFRIDKPGTGDSEGVCSATDFTTEFDGYRRAFRALRADRRIDPKRIIIMGISNGGGVAPLIIDGEQQPAAYVTIDGWSKTWFEHMLALERRRLILSGAPRDRLDAAMAGFSAFYAKYLLEGMTPGQALMERPDLKELWYDKADSQYGRPAAFYQQLQHLDLAAAWSKVRAPSLIVWGEYDWIMERTDQEQIVELANADGVQRAKLFIVPAADHNFGSHPNQQAAFDHGGDGSYPAEAGKAVVDFIRKVSSVTAH